MKHTIQSQALAAIYHKWLNEANNEKIKFVDEIYQLAETLYGQGGDVICECYSPNDIVEKFSSIEDAQEFIEAQNEARDSQLAEIF